MTPNFQHSKNRQGYSLIEAVIYIAVLTLIMAIVVNGLLVISKSHRSIIAARAIEQSALTALEIIGREVREATALDSAISVFNLHPGRLALETLGANDSPGAVEFYLEESRLWLKENGLVKGALSDWRAEVTNLVFRNLESGGSRAIRIELTLAAGSGQSQRSENFYSTIFLRNL